MNWERENNVSNALLKEQHVKQDMLITLKQYAPYVIKVINKQVFRHLNGDDNDITGLNTPRLNKLIDKTLSSNQVSFTIQSKLFIIVIKNLWMY